MKRATHAPETEPSRSSKRGTSEIAPMITGWFVGNPRRLWVCWNPPQGYPEENDIVLSFLPPAAEDALERECQGRMIHAREASRSIRTHARALYCDLVARIGTVPVDSNRSMRQALAGSGESSPWWFHPVAFKDCESDPTFQWIITVLTIRAVAQQHGAEGLVLVGAPAQVSAAIKGAFKVEELSASRSPGLCRQWLRSLGSRTAYVARTLRQWLAIQRWTRIPRRSLDVAFSGFWDWSVWQEPQSDLIRDRYFKRLPEELKSRGSSSCGWFAWFDPEGDPSQRGRKLKGVLSPLRQQPDIILLQSFLRPIDILKAALDFRPLMIFLQIRSGIEFRNVFRWEGLDYYPLFEAQLLEGFANAALPHGELVAMSVERACRLFRPKISLSFLEHFPYSRAYYAGVRRAGTGTLCMASQHASYCREKTFLYMHPSQEFRGEPDGCSVPHPDFVCAMGTLGKELFLECGYRKERVAVTGSPRYDYLAHSNMACPSAHGTRRDHVELRILIAASMALPVELDLVEAVCTAVHGMTGVKVLLREHPFSLISEHPAFAKLRGKVQITNGSLDEDLAYADLVVFTYSTVAEEAFLQNKPVWQWLPQGFNGSALVEVVSIPQFGSVKRLRDALLVWRDNRGRFEVAEKVRQIAIESLFFQDDGKAAQRIAATAIRFLTGKEAEDTQEKAALTS